jgi:transcription elongation factor Elf1
MAEIIDIEERRPVWVFGFEVCGLCGFMSFAICHKDRLFALECSRCGEMSAALVPEGVVDIEAAKAWRKQHPERASKSQ